MNETQLSRPRAHSRGAPRTSLVWDAPVRAFHWLMVACFAAAWLSAESEHWRLLHVTAGYTMAGLVAFRIVWGFVGTRHARFADFVRGPRAALGHLGALLRRESQAGHPAGHNPLGALAIVAMLGLTLAIAASGWASFNELGGKWLEELHEGAAEAMLVLVGVHVAGVLIVSRLQRENLIGAMIDGRKAVAPQEGVRSARRGVALLMLAAVIGGWWLQWQSAPSDRALAAATAKPKAHHDPRNRS